MKTPQARTLGVLRVVVAVGADFAADFSTFYSGSTPVLSHFIKLDCIVMRFCLTRAFYNLSDFLTADSLLEALLTGLCLEATGLTSCLAATFFLKTSSFLGGSKPNK